MTNTSNKTAPSTSSSFSRSLTSLDAISPLVSDTKLLNSTTITPMASNSASKPFSLMPGHSNSSVSLQTNESFCSLQPNFNYTPVSIAPVGSGYQYASACVYAAFRYWDVMAKWNATLQSLGVSRTMPTLVEAIPATTETWHETLSSEVISPWALTELCDGFPRVHGDFTSTSIFHSTSTSTIVRPAYNLTSFTVANIPKCKISTPPYASPLCSFPLSDCISLQSMFTMHVPAGVAPDELVNCAKFALSGTSSWSTVLTESCRILASSVQLYYWPATTIGTSFCGSDGPTWSTLAPPASHRIATITLDSGKRGWNDTSSTMAMPSPLVYLAFQGVSAHSLSRELPAGPFGHVFSANKIISMSAEELQSIEQHVPGFSGPWQSELSMIVSGGTWNAFNMIEVPKSYNLFNLQRPVPASDYFFRAPDLVAYPESKVPQFQPLDTTIRDNYNARIPVFRSPLPFLAAGNPLK